MKPIIRVENLSKQYILGGSKEGQTTFRESIVNAARLPLDSLKNRQAAETHYFKALNDVNFAVYPGEVVGIIGKNGAGKSTLLKILSRITEPTGGKVELYGRVGSLLEVGTGFHPELTGRENVFLNGAILGMKREEIAKKFDEIVDFAEIENFLDTPVKRYSSGMYMRLAFAVAANLEPEILVVDEVLAVGDAEFQRKCLGKMKSVSDKEGRTVLFVSHNMGAVRQLCSKGIYLEQGTVRFDGETNEAINIYLNSTVSESKAYERSAAGDENDEKKELEFERVSLEDITGAEKYSFDINSEILINFKIEIKRQVKNSSLFVLILNQDKNPVCAFESEGLENKMILKINSRFLVRGNYSLHAFLHVPRLKQFDVIYDQVPFEVTDFDSRLIEHGAYNYGSVFGSGEWLN